MKQDDAARGRNGPLKIYRLFGVNERDVVISAEEIQCENDFCARAVAEAKVTDRIGVEVWEVGRRVGKFHARLREGLA